MLSKPEVYNILANQFVGLRFDWEQGNYYKEKFGFILGTGDQLLLDPTGEPIRHEKPGKGEQSSCIYGRHGCDTTGDLLQRIAARYATKSAELKLEWFLWPRKPARRPGGYYPVSYESMAGYARLPLAFIEGAIPTALNDPDFLRWHVRQFIWVRGESNGPSRIVLKRVKDGLKPGLSTELATIDPQSMTRGGFGQSLDQAWLEYMKNRPLTARGYLENPHGKWMRALKEQMIFEDEEVRSRARAGTLLPPGRKAGEASPYRPDLSAK